MPPSRSPHFIPHLLCGLLLLCFPLSLSHAQYKVKSVLLHAQGSSSSSVGLSLFGADSLKSDTMAVVRQSKSALTAVLLSALLPGAGQIYTERYWKVPLILGFGAYFVRQWARADGLYENAREKYRLSVERGENGGQGDGQALYERNFYRDERDRFGFYIALTYLLNILDAYVGASLYDFDVDDSLNGVALRIQIPLR